MAFHIAPAGYESLSEDEVLNLPFVIDKSELAFKNYTRVTKKWFRYPTGQTFQYDTVSKNATYVQFVCFNSQTKHVTVICEFAAGLGKMMWTMPGGGYDPQKHASIIECVQSEMSEEVRLRQPDATRIIPLTQQGISFSKSSEALVQPFLILDAERDPAPKEMDAEEFIFVADRKIEDVFDWIAQGQFMGSGLAMFMLAVERLRRRS